MTFTIRKAAFSDIEDIYSILIPYSKEGMILERSRDDIEKNIEKFFVAEIKNIIAGVISYYNYNEKLKEVRSLAVKKEYYKKGIGLALIKALVESLLSEFADARIFALTYHPEFFRKAGFVDISRDSLPEKIWKDCQNCINQQDCGETALIFSKQ